MKLLTILHDFLYWERPRNPRCSFCRRRYHEVGELLVHGCGNAFICDTCIGHCREHMDAEKRRRGLIPSVEVSPVNSPASIPDQTSEST